MDNNTIRDGFIGQKMIVLPKEVKKVQLSNPITHNFYITDLGYFPKATHHFRKRDNGTKEYIFIYCAEGEGWVKTKDIKSEVLPNQYFILPKNEKHSYGANKNNPWSIYWMHFDGVIAGNMYDRNYNSSPVIATIPFNNSRIKIFNQVFEILQSNYIAPQLEYANILGLTFLSSFIFNDINKSLNIGHGENLVDSIIYFLNENLDKTLKSQDIAKEFNYSSSYIFTLFKRKTGYSLIYFFNLKKIQKACEYINYTDLSIKQISFKVGFQDPLYFSRIFKKYMGISPKSYKQMATK